MYCCDAANSRATCSFSASEKRLTGASLLAAFLRVRRLAAREHRDELLDPPRTRVGSLRRRHAIEDRVAVLLREVLEEGLRLRLGGQRGREIRRHLDRRRPGVGGLPASVALRTLDLRETGRMHAALGGQTFRNPDVPLRPRAALSPRREPLLVRRLVAAANLAVDPPVAERLVERLVVREARRRLRALLREDEPDAVHVGVMLRQPLAPRRGVAHDQLRLLGAHAAEPRNFRTGLVLSEVAAVERGGRDEGSAWAQPPAQARAAPVRQQGARAVR